MDLDDLQLFQRIVETGSLRGAALEQGLDPSRVTRRLAALEARLGAKLIQRSRRRSGPTEAGELLHAGLRPLLEQLEALTAEVGGVAEQPRGLLRVAAPAEFGVRFVVPVLRSLQEAHPALRVELLLGSEFVDLIAQNVDVAVRVGRLPDSSLVAARLGHAPRVLVASPSYLERRGIPESVDELSQHDFVLWRGERVQLEFEQGSVEVRGRCAVNSLQAITALVIAGEGLHLGPLWAFEPALRAGELVAVLPQSSARPFPVHALYRAGDYVPAKVRALVDALRLAVEEIDGLEPSCT